MVHHPQSKLLARYHRIIEDYHIIANFIYKVYTSYHFHYLLDFTPTNFCI